MKELKYSRQRESIKDFLMTRKDHPTAEEVYLNVRKTFPNISLGTVYRNLSLLTSIGSIQKISCGDSCERFDASTDSHYHFICRKCGCVMDMDMPDLSFINTLADKSFCGEIEGSVTYFFGLCEKCSQEYVDKPESKR
ncbi:Fur family transcriptional regulator [Parasporobacterium paucivorans]|uniref:Fur family transcriptional regulator, peroxide stress response regulator n=1 Tax=Parasporobacterium paucivorans DSM 15970 TaxID=1122934 RepID=A0A1M6BFH7_9FIRM|nr:transcriptional repressor [Parasporobacterium paucivorans]SHI47492.1 Fur family transcriptional regulator, peroxide stress response regulator [Parasporobacterium paucivorans DSM 15970]